MTASILYRSIHKSFGETEVLRGIDLEVKAGEFIVFVGPSGCGKSTLLRLTAGLEDVTSGSILIDNNDVTDLPPGERGLAMVFQNYALYPHMSVRQNIGFALRMAKVPVDEANRKIEDVAAMLDLTPYLDRKPRELSGGQRQRVAIGRAIVREPQVFLFDEPLSNLDAALRVQTRQELMSLHRRLGSTMVYVTHDQVEAMTMADRIVVLNAGIVEQIDTPMALYTEPASLFVAEFIGSPKMNILRGEIAERQGASVLGIRPEHVGISMTEGGWPVQAQFIERLGPETYVHGTLGDGQNLVMRVAGDFTIEPGSEVFAVADLDHAHLFGAGGQRLQNA